jgi:hypothetical protein
MADLDQGGIPRIWQRQFLGPSVGWTQSPSDDSTFPINVGGTYNIDRSIRYIPVQTQTAGGVVINLPPAADPAVPAIAMPGPFVNSFIIVTDIGGNLAHLPISIVAQPGETINGNASVQISSAYGYVLLIPNPGNKLWSTSLSNPATTLSNIIVPPSGDTSGVTDHTNITSALANVTPGNDVELLVGTYYTNGTLLVSRDGTGIVGAGDNGTNITTITGVGSFPVVKVSRSTAQVFNWYLGYFAVSISSSGAIGVQIDSSDSGKAECIAVTDSAPSSTAFLMRVDQNATCTNNFYLNLIAFLTAGATNGIAYSLTSSVSNQDVDLSIWMICGCLLSANSQTGWHIGAADGNVFINAGVGGFGVTVAPTIINFDYSNPANPNWPTDNMFLFFDAGFDITQPAIFTNTGTPSNFANNTFYYFNQGNGTVAPYTLKGVDVLMLENIFTFSSPAVTASTGTFTSVSCGLWLKVVGKTVYYHGEITVTTVGSASGSMRITLPYGPPTANEPGNALDISGGTNPVYCFASTANNRLEITPASIAAHLYSFAGFYEQNPP